MTYHSIKNISYSASIGFHILVLLILLLIKFTIEGSSKEYVELSFGVSGKEGSSGNIGEQVTQVEELAKTETKNETQNKTKVVKQVELPKAKSTSEDNNIQPAEKDKKLTRQNKTETKEETNSNVTSTGQGNKAQGEGSFGYDIDWGGKGQRKIYNYILPAYPEGVSKEVDIRLRFSILPDGTVGTIFPLTKADTRLENAAINYLRQWRFEPLDTTQAQVEQTAIIVFPFRLQ
jgi:outer membrane biosynthesis protein TonB